MLYNEARFASPFEFGARYQLTVSDVSKNTVTLSLLGLSFYHYFIQPPAIKEIFPHLGLRFSLVGSPERYLYRASTVGCLFFGVPAGLLLSPISRTVRKNRALFATFLSCGILSLLLAFLDTCLGGVNLRYATDFLPMLSAFGVLSCLLVARDCQKKLRAVFTALSLLLFALAIVLVLGILRNNPYGQLLIVP